MATAAKFVHPIPIVLAYLDNRSSFLELGVMGWGDVRYCFAMAILVIIIIILPHIFVCSISRRGGHFGFKVAAIANQNGRHMVHPIGKPRVSPLHFLNTSAVIWYLICVYASHFFAGRPG
jgi:hypothetical protein